MFRLTFLTHLIKESILACAHVQLRVRPTQFHWARYIATPNCAFFFFFFVCARINRNVVILIEKVPYHLAKSELMQQFELVPAGFIPSFLDQKQQKFKKMHLDKICSILLRGMLPIIYTKRINSNYHFLISLYNYLPPYLSMTLPFLPSNSNQKINYQAKWKALFYSLSW